MNLSVQLADMIRECGIKICREKSDYIPCTLRLGPLLSAKINALKH